MTNLEEGGRIKCTKYWTESGSCCFGDIMITMREVIPLPDFVIRKFNVKRTDGIEKRNIQQFHFTAWPEFGVPIKPTSLLRFIAAVKKWKEQNQSPMVTDSLFLLHM